LPIRIPVINIHTVGSGGGSIAYVDAGGALRAGPQSAGANPGPVCYGRGGRQPTVTDANLVLGRLAPDYFLGGHMPLDLHAATQALTELAQEAGLLPQSGTDGLNPAQGAALGVIQVANAHMERALRVISVERGYDPRDFVLVSFGGAGGLHACDLARGLGIRRVLIPPGASTLSAFGMLTADVVKDYVQTVMLSGDTPYDELDRRLRSLAERGSWICVTRANPMS
jgi:N-methylhydantoinase A